MVQRSSWAPPPGLVPSPLTPTPPNADRTDHNGATQPQPTQPGDPTATSSGMGVRTSSAAINTAISSMATKTVSGKKLLVRGIGGKTRDPGRYEHEDQLRSVFQTYGEVAQVDVNHCVDKLTGANTSWAVVRFRFEKGAKNAQDAAKQQKIKPRGCAHGPFVVTQYDPSQEVEKGGSDGRCRGMSLSNGSFRKLKKAKVALTVGSELHQHLSELRALIGFTQGLPAEAEYDDDSDSEDEAKWVMDPEGRVRTHWDAAQVVFLVYVAALVPLRFGFSLELEAFSTGWWIELVVDLFFLADFVINFKTGYYDESTLELMTDCRGIAVKYLRGWFLIDFVSILPVGYINQLVNQNGEAVALDTKILKILRMLRLAKLLRLAKVERLVKKYNEQFEGLMNAFKLLSTLILALFIAHLLSCVWYSTGHHEQGWVAVKFPQALTPSLTCEEIEGNRTITQELSKMGCRDEVSLSYKPYIFI